MSIDKDIKEDRQFREREAAEKPIHAVLRMAAYDFGIRDRRGHLAPIRDLARRMAAHVGVSAEARAWMALYETVPQDPPDRGPVFDGPGAEHAEGRRR